MKQLSKSYNLEERTAVFGEKIIDLCKEIPSDTVSKPLISQIVRSSTSIGANYMEANSASSKKDFCNKIFLCKKEANETRHWLRMIVRCLPDKRDQIAALWQESKELAKIFQKITMTIRSKT